MHSPENSGIIIQARTGSTRLPQKMKMTFFEKLSLAQVIFKKLQPLCDKLPVILATSISKDNDCLEEWATEYGLKTFRGDENDVLTRFIGAAEKFNIKTIVRVCADNPLLSVPHIAELLNNYSKDPADYLSYKMKDGTPVIKSHLGLFTEVVSLKALLKVKQLTSEPLYMEHVTNYIYSHPEKFNVRFLDLPDDISERNDIRLTIDTLHDFETSSAIFNALQKNENLDITVSEIISYLRNNPAYVNEMKGEIEKNAK